MTDTSADADDDQNQGSEQFDAMTEEEVGPADFPPERPWGAEAYGAGGADVQEGVAERAARENPDFPVHGDDHPVAGLTDIDDPLDGDLTAESIAEEVDAPEELSAEEAAMHAYSSEEAEAHGLDLDGPPHDGYYADGEY
ncbi:MAG TPA: hypothetical protein VIY72_13150 [Acidimicrobiales bacterium]